MTRAAARPAPRHAEGVEVPYDALGFPLPPPRRSFPGADPGADAPADRRPAYAVVPGRPRLVAERAVALLEEVAATWDPDAARAVWADEDAKRERATLRVDVGYDTAVCARLDAAKRLMLSRARPPR